MLPHQRPLHALVGFWLQRIEDPDATLLDAAQIAAHNRGLRDLRSRTGLPSGRWDLLDLAVEPQALRRGWRGGIVLLYLKGHIMLFVGRDGDQLYALHQVSGYLVPCEKPDSGASETMLIY